MHPGGNLSPDSEASLRALDVVKHYGGVKALNGVSLHVKPDECVALVGESGSGKSTLLRLFNRTVLPDSGEVYVGGRRADQADVVRLRRTIGYVQQEGGLLPHWTVLHNASLVPRLEGERDANERGRHALDLVGLDPAHFSDRWPRELSGGQRQRVALARALAHEPKIVLLDEPFGALDAITRSELQESFAELIRTLGVTVLLVTHDLHEAFLLADRVAVLRDGLVEQVAAARALVHEPTSRYVAELVRRARIDRWDGDGERPEGSRFADDGTEESEVERAELEKPEGTGTEGEGTEPA